jgi:hypothetical protein
LEAATLIADLASRGITLVAEPPDLFAESEAEISEPDRVLIRLHKQPLLAVLLEKSAVQREAAEIERIAKLDAERNERDRRLGRGYDYDGRSHGSVVRNSPHIDLVVGDPVFDRCELSGGPARVVEQLFAAAGWKVVPPMRPFFKDEEKAYAAAFPQGRTYEAKSPFWTSVTLWNYPPHRHGVDPECALSGLFGGEPAAQFGCQFVRGKQMGPLRHQPLVRVADIEKMLSFLARQADEEPPVEFRQCSFCDDRADLVTPQGKRFCGDSGGNTVAPDDLRSEITGVGSFRRLKLGVKWPPFPT